MRTMIIYVHGRRAGRLEEIIREKSYRVVYDEDYKGVDISLNLPHQKNPYEFNEFPPFFDGLLPEGYQLESLLKGHKIDRKDFFQQLLVVGLDLVGAVTVMLKEE